MESKAGFNSLAEELQSYILSFLPCRDILRCTSVCKALRQTYVSSFELQYIVELGGQQLLPVPNTNHTPISKRLQLLRDKAHAWFKFDMFSFKTVALPEDLYNAREKNVTHGHLYLLTKDGDRAAVIPILPKPSQQTIERDWSRGTSPLCPVPYLFARDVFIDPAQNLIAVVYNVDHQTSNIDLRALDGDGVHPQAAGRTLFLSGLPIYGDSRISDRERPRLKICGRHIALQRCVYFLHGTTLETMWQLQIWDWQHSTTSNSVLGETPASRPNEIDFCFLGNNRLLIVHDTMKLYLIDDMSQTPQLLASFLFPLNFRNAGWWDCLLPKDDIEQPQMQVQQTIYISDPKSRLLCLSATSFPPLFFVISTRIFFDLDGTAAATPIPWTHWGPSNARIFEHPCNSEASVSGNRVLLAYPVGRPNLCPEEYILHLMDFSPLAVTNRRGLGRVVKEPSSTNMTGRSDDPSLAVTSLPYVEVVLDRRFGYGQLEGMWLDKDRIYILHAARRGVAATRLEVIDV